MAGNGTHGIGDDNVTIRKGSIVRIADAEKKVELLVTDVGEDGRCSVAHIGAMHSNDTRFSQEALLYVRDATDEEKRSTDKIWTRW